MQCPRCQRENRADATFCDGCGIPLQHPFGSTQPARSYAEVQRSLTEALDQQAATSEILRVIRSSPTDVQPVFDAIVATPTRLSEPAFGAAFRFDGPLQTFVAHHDATRNELVL